MDIEQTYREFAPGLLAFIRARAPTVAEDIHHDVWVAAIRQPQALRGDDLKKWLFRVAINAITDYRKKASTRREKYGQGADDANLPGRTAPDTLATDELVAILRGCVEQLPEPFRLVVQAKLAGETPDETASRLQISRATVDTRYHRAREKLAACSGADQP